MIVYALDSRTIESVWIGGKRIYHVEEGYQKIDIEKVREKVQEIRNRLMEEIRIKQ